jgi:hypothetical protein
MNKPPLPHRRAALQRLAAASLCASPWLSGSVFAAVFMDAEQAQKLLLPNADTFQALSLLLDEPKLSAIAKASEGEFFRAGNSNDLKQIYEHLSTKFALERRDTEISALWAALSLVLLLCAGGLSLVWFRRQPWGQA